jgi:arylsulfatase A-like enzyme
MDDALKADLIALVLEQGRLTTTDTAVHREKTFSLPSDQPFFLACGIFRPHLPWIAPREFVNRFSADDIAIDREFFLRMVDDIRDLPPGGQKLAGTPEEGFTTASKRFRELLRQGAEREPDGDLRAWREMIRHYLACVAFADHCIGRLLNGLDSGPYRDNTVVVLWSDHGWDLGVKYRASKVALWESTTECVLIVQDPQTPAAFRGVPSFARVSLQDLYPTIAARAGLKQPATVAGHDFSPLLRDPQRPWDSFAITTHGPRNHALRGERYRYIRYVGDPDNAELYDGDEDPREHINLIADPALQDVRRKFDQRLETVISAGPFPYDTGAKRRKNRKVPDGS